MEKQFCTYCFENLNCAYEEKMTSKEIDGIEINYLEKYYVCSKCKNKIYGDLLDYNTHAINEVLRKKKEIITAEEISEILEMYSVSQKNLSKILGFGEIQISRYLKSGNPSKEHSDILKSIKESPFIYEGYLLASMDKLDKKTYKKQLGIVKQLELVSEHSKIYNVGLYLISKIDDITNLSLQKILYFLYGFSNKFLGCRIFEDEAEAWAHGPVYKEMYHAFSYFVRDNLDITEVLKDREYELSDEEKEYIDNVSKYFSCYGGSKLRDMSHFTDPWINARVGLDENEPSNRIIEENDIDKYFNEIIEEYNITEYKDIKKYSDDLFNKSLTE